MPHLVEVSPGVLVATSRREATTSTVVVGRSGTALLVDPAWEPDELASLADELAAAGITVEAGLATHAHYDHLLWHPRFGDVPRWASGRTQRTVERQRPALLADLGPDWPPELAAAFGQLTALTSTRVPFAGAVVEVVEHDGHAPGHLAAWLPEERVLLAGDMLSDVELPLPDEQLPLEAYADALDRLHPYAATASVVVPGHGSVGFDPLDRWEADRHYLTALLQGDEPVDPRLANAGMAQAHATNLRLARHPPPM